jgi:hypothetical protein
MKIRCDAVSDAFREGSVYCKRPAEWSAVWGVGSGKVYYCRYHKASRQKDVSLGDWRKLKD